MVNCSRCGARIIRDRYNISFILERQDFPPSGNWQKSIDRYKEDICSKCANKIMRIVHRLFDG